MRTTTVAQVTGMAQKALRPTGWCATIPAMARSCATARLAEMVQVAAFPGLGNKGRTEEQFLPFKITDAPGKNARITQQTAQVIRELIREGQMPQRVLVLAMEELERSGF